MKQSPKHQMRMSFLFQHLKQLVFSIKVPPYQSLSLCRDSSLATQTEAHEGWGAAGLTYVPGRDMPQPAGLLPGTWSAR